MKKLTLFIWLLSSTIALQANNLRITDLANPSNHQITFKVAWDNAWQAGDFHDAVWLFVKYRSSNSNQWLHADVISASADGGFDIVTQADQKGIFIKLTQDFIGNTPQQTITMDLGNIQGVFPDFKVFGVEMVYVKEEAFYLGDGSGGAPHRYHPTGNNAIPYHVTSENAIAGGSIEVDFNGSFQFNFNNNIPAAFPKGYGAFYCMKYEITQQQYVDFLNTLSRPQQNERTATDISGTSITNVFVMSNKATVSARQGIRCDASLSAGAPVDFYCDRNNNGVANEANDGQAIACNYLSHDDYLAYLDWAALRPMTDFEYEKAARGPMNPTPKEFVWGTNTMTIIGNLTSSGTESESVANIGSNGLANSKGAVGNNNFGPIRVGFAASATSNREQSGAGYYGMMNLGDNLAEFTFIPTATNPALNFTGTSGDGVLSIQGKANETSWGNFDNEYLHFRVAGFRGLYNTMETSDFEAERAYLSHTGTFRFNQANSRLLYTGGRGVR